MSVWGREGVRTLPVGKTNLRVLPSTNFALIVNNETTQFKAVNRTGDTHANDLVLTLFMALNVTAVFTPDVPGTYQVLVTIVDSCNSTAQVGPGRYIPPRHGSPFESVIEGSNMRVGDVAGKGNTCLSLRSGGF